MRALFTCRPGHGSFYPMVPFASALQGAGHDVAFVTSEMFSDRIRQAGFECIPGGYNFVVGHPHTNPPVFSTVRELATPMDRLLFAHTRIFRGFEAREMIRDLLDIARTWQPDLIVREKLEFAGCVVAELLDLPHAAAGAAEFYPPSTEEAFRPSLDKLRADHGLPPDPEGLMPHRYLTLTAVPPEWVGKHEYCPPTTHFVRPEPYSGPNTGDLPNWITTLPDRPTVHASMGTVFNLMPGIYESIIEALRDEPINLILTIGPQRDPASFGDLPDHIKIERYLPHAQLLPHCDVIIAHAGYGSTIAFLMEGIPAVLMPLGGDQHRNASRVADFGAGIVLSEANRTPESIRHAVRELLDSSDYRDAALKVKARLEGLPGPDYAVERLELLAREQQPIPY